VCTLCLSCTHGPVPTHPRTPPPLSPCPSPYRLNTGHVMSALRMFDDDAHFYRQVVDDVCTERIPLDSTQIAISLIDVIQVLNNRFDAATVRCPAAFLSTVLSFPRKEFQKGPVPAHVCVCHFNKLSCPAVPVPLPSFVAARCVVPVMQLLKMNQAFVRLCEPRCKSVRLYAMAFLAFALLSVGRLSECEAHARVALELAEIVERENPGVASFPFQVGCLRPVCALSIASLPVCPRRVRLWRALSPMSALYPRRRVCIPACCCVRAPHVTRVPRCSWLCRCSKARWRRCL
jgi:hypothetical protein